MSTAIQANNKSAWMGGESPFKISYGKLMMWYFLMSDAFTFGAFLISYGTHRYASKVWPDSNEVFKAFPWMDKIGAESAPLVFVSFMTFVLIVSSVTMVLAVHEGHCMNKKGVVKWMLWTIVGGIIFLSCQAWEWTHLHHEGAWWGSFTENGLGLKDFGHFYNKRAIATDAAVFTAEGARSVHDFFNYFFTITGFHGFHVFTGVIFLIIILINAILGTYEKRGHYEMVEKVGLYWHFVDLVWVFVFTCFYLL
jgi:cytochrome c oxidase subunit III